MLYFSFNNIPLVMLDCRQLAQGVMLGLGEAVKVQEEHAKSESSEAREPNQIFGEPSRAQGQEASQVGYPGN